MSDSVKPLASGVRPPYRRLMGVGDPAFGLVTDILRDMARAVDDVARVEAVLEVVAATVGADLAMLLLAAPAQSVIRVVGLRLPEGVDAALAREIELSGSDDPLIEPVARGDLAPRTAARAFGPEVWASSSRRAACLRVCGVDQVATLPLSAGPDLCLAMFGRAGDDFTDEDLGRLASVRPVIADLVALAGVPAPRGPVDRPRLTVRETEVLALLSRGYTCSRIARSLGASPRTVEVHLGRIYAKLGVRDRLSAVLAAYDLALIPPRPTDVPRLTASG